MRTIKFRAWNKDDNEPMFDPFETGLRFGTILHSPWVEIMQFTGLTDKNGVECYEDDIVFWKHLGEYGVVYFNDEELAYFVKPIKTERETESCLDSTHMEVIGNIHENPELIQH